MYSINNSLNLEWKGKNHWWSVFTWIDWAICVTKTGGSFKSLAVLFAKTTTSESGSTTLEFNQRQWINRNRNRFGLKLPEGFQVSASLYLCPSISMSNRMGTKFSAVGLWINHSLVITHCKHQPTKRNSLNVELTFWTWRGFCRNTKSWFSCYRNMIMTDRLRRRLDGKGTQTNFYASSQTKPKSPATQFLPLIFIFQINVY